MSRATKWQIPFYSDNGKQYRIDINVEGWSGSATTLTGGEHPITTSEDDNNDPLTPIRQQTGYIRTVMSEDDWEDLIPDDNMAHQVILYEIGGSTSTVRWWGFMKAEGYKTDLYQGECAVYEYPIVCPLTVLSGFELNLNPGLYTLHYLLYCCLSYADTSFNHVFFPDNLHDTSGHNYDLNAQANYLNLVTHNDEYDPESEDSDDNRRWNPEYNCLEIIEEICRYWGWTLRISGRDLYFVSTDEDCDYRQWDYEELEYDLTGGRLTVSSSTIDLTDAVADTRGAQVEWVTGNRKAIVTADINKVSDPVMKWPIDEFSYETYGTTTKDEKTYAYRKNLLYNATTENVGIYSYWQMFRDTTVKFWDYVPEELFEHDEIYSNAWPPARNVQIDSWDTDNPSAHHNHSWSPYLILGYLRYQTSSTSELIPVIEPAFRMCSNYAEAFAQGMLCIKANVTGTEGGWAVGEWNQNGNYIESGELKHSVLTAQLRIGSKYWNGTTFQTTACTFTIPWGDDTEIYDGTNESDCVTGTGKIITTKSMDDPYDGAEGYGIIIDEVMIGDIELTVYMHDVRFSEFLKITDLSVFFVKENDTEASNADANSNVYKKVLSRKYEEDATVDTIFASDKNNAFGHGLLFAYDGGYLQTLVYSDLTIARPEVRLRNRMETFFGTNTKVLSIPYYDTDGPLPIDYLTIDSINYTPVSESIDWVDGTTKIKMEERK